MLAVGQLEAQGRKLVAEGQQAIAEKDWAAAEDSLAQAAEVWATMESRTRGAEKGSYAPYAAAASEALEELQDAGAPPSRETTLQSLRHLVAHMKDLKTPVDLIDLFAPDDLRAIFAVSEKKAQEWAILANDP